MGSKENAISSQITNLQLPSPYEVEHYLSLHPRRSIELVNHLKSLTKVAEESRAQLDPIAESDRGPCTQKLVSGTDGESTVLAAPDLTQCPQAKFLIFDKNIAKACGVKTAIIVENISLNVAKQLQRRGRHSSVCDVSVSFTQENMARHFGFGRAPVRKAVAKAIASGYITTDSQGQHGRLAYRLTEKSAHRALGGGSTMSLWCVRVGDLGVMNDWAATVLCGFRARIREEIAAGGYVRDGRYSWYGSVAHLYKKHYAGHFSRRNLDRFLKDLLESGRLIRKQCDWRSSMYEWALGDWDENDLLWELVSPRNGSPHAFLDHQFVRPVPWESYTGTYPAWAAPLLKSADKEEAE